MNITKHTFERMRERGFTVEMLGKVLRRKDLVRDSSDKEGVSKITSEVDNRFWTLIVSSKILK